MLSPRYLAGLSDEIAEIYAQLEADILENMARRLSRLNTKDAAKWQAQVLAETGAEGRKGIGQSHEEGLHFGNRLRKWKTSKTNGNGYVTDTFSRMDEKHGGYAHFLNDCVHFFKKLFKIFFLNIF